MRRLLQAAAQTAADDLVAEEEESERADVDDTGGNGPNDKLQAPSGGVRILLHMCVLILLPHTATYVSSCHDACVLILLLILLHMCPHVSSY